MEVNKVRVNGLEMFILLRSTPSASPIQEFLCSTKHIFSSQIQLIFEIDCQWFGLWDSFAPFSPSCCGGGGGGGKPEYIHMEWHLLFEIITGHW